MMDGVLFEGVLILWALLREYLSELVLVMEKLCCAVFQVQPIVQDEGKK